MNAALTAGLSAQDADEPFWTGARAGRLVLTRCARCGRLEHPPRTLCIHCGSRDLAAVEAAGTGTVASFTVVQRALLPELRDAIPYVLALIDLSEPLRMMSLVRDCPSEDLRIGLAVEVAFERIDDTFVLPVFRPRPRSAATVD